MEAVNHTARRWGVIAGIIEDEARHRHANEFANALAAVQLARAALNDPNPLMDRAILRLEGQVRLERLILRPDTHDVEIAVRALCDLLGMTRAFSSEIQVAATEPDIHAGDGLMRIILKVTYELVSNAVRWSQEYATPIFVTISARRAMIEVVVRNQLGAIHANVGKGGMGLLVARRMAVSFGGRLQTSRDGDDHLARLRLPLGGPQRD